MKHNKSPFEKNLAEYQRYSERKELIRKIDHGEILTYKDMEKINDHICEQKGILKKLKAIKVGLILAKTTSAVLTLGIACSIASALTHMADAAIQDSIVESVKETQEFKTQYAKDFPDSENTATTALSDYENAKLSKYVREYVEAHPGTKYYSALKSSQKHARAGSISIAWLLGETALFTISSPLAMIGSGRKEQDNKTRQNAEKDLEVLCKAK